MNKKYLVLLFMGLCNYQLVNAATQTAQKEVKKSTPQVKSSSSKPAVTAQKATEQAQKNKTIDQKSEQKNVVAKKPNAAAQDAPATNVAAGVSKNRHFIDGIACRVNGPERSYIVCDSDKFKPGLAPINAERQKMDPFDNAIVNSYIDGLCRQNNWSMSDLEQVLSRSLLTLQEGIKELKKMYAVNYMTEMKMQTIVVPEEEIVAYYNAHPIYKEARIKAERAFVPFDYTISREMQLNQLVEFSNKGTGSTVEWSKPCWFVENELADHLKFIISLQPPTISEPRETNGGFELYRIVINKPRAKVSLKKRYKQIVAQLRQEKAAQIIAQYKKKLFDSASVVYFAHEKAITPA
jgi:hypothetical protein